MNSNMISKVEKARTYAEEKGRVRMGRFTASFRGNHNSYEVSYDSGTWQCTCPSFQTRELCSHTMAMERILDGMLVQNEVAGAN